MQDKRSKYDEFRKEGRTREISTGVAKRMYIVSCSYGKCNFFGTIVGGDYEQNTSTRGKSVGVG